MLTKARSYAIELEQTTPNGALIQRCRRGRSRLYRVEGDPRVAGLELPNVTTILNVIAKPELIPWANKEGRKAFYSALAPSVGSVLTLEALDAAMEKAGRAPEETRQAAADRGTDSHKVISAALTGDGAYDLALNDDSARMVRNFTAWLRGSGLRFHASEVMVYHPVLCYAGTIDLLLWRDEELGIWDIKTGGIYEESAYQVAAYADAWLETFGQEVAFGGVIGIGKDAPEVREIDDLSAPIM